VTRKSKLRVVDPNPVEEDNELEVDLFTTIDGEKILRKEYPHRRWVLDPLLPEGLAFLAGDAKSGKGHLVYDAILHLIRKFLREGIGEVLYLNMEEDELDIQERLRDKLQGEELDLSRLHFVTADNMDVLKIGGGFEEQLSMWMELHPETRLIVTDVYAQVKPDQKSDIFGGDYDGLKRIRRFARSNHIGILIVHHTSKRPFDPSRPFNSINGSTGLLAVVDVIMVLHHPFNDEEQTPKLYIDGKAVAGKQAYEIKLDDLTGTWLGLPLEEHPGISDNEQKVLNAIGNEIMSPKQMQAKSGLSDLKSFRTLIHRMHRKGLLAAFGSYGKYCKPEVLACYNEKRYMDDFDENATQPAPQAAPGQCYMDKKHGVFSDVTLSEIDSQSNEPLPQQNGHISSAKEAVEMIYSMGKGYQLVIGGDGELRLRVPPDLSDEQFDVLIDKIAPYTNKIVELLQNREVVE
jgi:AAA domain